jgi:hypothetical protein
MTLILLAAIVFSALDICNSILDFMVSPAGHSRHQTSGIFIRCLGYCSSYCSCFWEVKFGVGFRCGTFESDDDTPVASSTRINYVLLIELGIVWILVLYTVLYCTRPSDSIWFTHNST